MKYHNPKKGSKRYAENRSKEKSTGFDHRLVQTMEQNAIHAYEAISGKNCRGSGREKYNEAVVFGSCMILGKVMNNNKLSLFHFLQPLLFNALKVELEQKGAEDKAFEITGEICDLTFDRLSELGIKI